MGQRWVETEQRCQEVAVGILLGIAVLVLGLLYAFAPDLMWELQHLSNSLDGQVSERTAAWEWKRKFAAGFMLVLAVLMFVIAFTG